MQLPLGISPIRPACERCGGKTMFAGRKPHPARGLPWELQSFVCTVCSAVTTRQPGDGTVTSGSPRREDATVRRLAWTDQYGTHTAVRDGQTYRIVVYPRGSPLAGKCGCYRGGRYAGLRGDLATAKAWCSALAASGGGPPA